jgi:nucleoside phosphorylase/tetratricopeptide (TPR) repeat protein
MGDIYAKWKGDVLDSIFQFPNLLESIAMAFSGEPKLPPCDALIVTAIKEEFDAVLGVDNEAVAGSRWDERVGPHGLVIAIREFQTSSKVPLRIAVTQAPEMGQAAAVATATSLLPSLRSQCLAMCGVCAGYRGKVGLGDVIIADRLWTYDVGKIERVTVDGDEHEEFYADTKTYNLSPPWKQQAERLAVPLGEWLQCRPPTLQTQEDWLLLKLFHNQDARTDPKRDTHCPNWKNILERLWKAGDLTVNQLTLSEKGRERASVYDLKYDGKIEQDPPFQINTGPLATGSSVIEDKQVFQRLKKLQRKVLGLDMETASMGMLAEIQQIPYHIAMKAVMDFADGEKNDFFKPFAARASAECLIAFLRENLPPRGTEPFPEDVLSKGTSKLPSNPKPSDLLRADYGVVPFSGREQLLKELEQWRKHEDVVRIQLIHSPGGMGKTRLFTHWASMVRESGENWTTGFMREPVKDGWFERLSCLGRPLLIGIDYAERWGSRRLAEVLEPLVKHNQSGRSLPVRVVLLARNAEVWWDELKSQSDSLLGALLTSHLPLYLQPLAIKPNQRKQIFTNASTQFAKVLNKKPEPEPPVPLDGPLFKRALYLLMAALVSVEGLSITSTDIAGTTPNVESQEGFDTSAEQVMAAVLDHEQRFWQPKSATSKLLTDYEQAQWPHAACYLMCAATLLGGLNHAQCQSLASRLWKDLDIRYHKDLLYQLHQLYFTIDSEELHLSPLMPDLLGEALVERTLNRKGLRTDFLQVVFHEESESCITHGLEVLGILSQHDDGISSWAPQILSPLEKRAHLALRASKRIGNRTAFGRLGDYVLGQIQLASKEAKQRVAFTLEREGFPVGTVSLRQLALWVSEERLTNLQVLADRFPNFTNKIALARMLNNVSTLQSSTGQSIEALENSQKSAILFESLVEDDRDRIAPDFAMILLNLGTRFGENSKHKEGLNHSLRALKMYEELAFKESDTFSPFVARSLNNISNTYSNLKQYSNALDYAKRATQLLQQLNSKFRGAYLPDFVMSIHNLANKYSQTNHHQDALRCAQTASELYRQLSVSQPDLFLPDFAMSLISLANRYSDLSDFQNAEIYAEKAVPIYESLAFKHQGAFSSGYIRSLGTFANILNQVEKHEEALNAMIPAVSLARKLVSKEPKIYIIELANLLNNQSDTFNYLGRSAEALHSIQEAVSFYEYLDINYPNTFEFELATSMSNLGIQLGKTHQLFESLKFAKKAVVLLRTLAGKDPRFYSPHLAMTLNNLAIAFHKVNRNRSALASSFQSLDIIWPYFVAFPMVHKKLLDFIFHVSHGLMTTLNLRPDQLWFQRYQEFSDIINYKQR